MYPKKAWNGEKSSINYLVLLPTVNNINKTTSCIAVINYCLRYEEYSQKLINLYITNLNTQKTSGSLWRRAAEIYPYEYLHTNMIINYSFIVSLLFSIFKLFIGCHRILRRIINVNKWEHRYFDQITVVNFSYNHSNRYFRMSDSTFYWSFAECERKVVNRERDGPREVFLCCLRSFLFFRLFHFWLSSPFLASKLSDPIDTTRLTNPFGLPVLLY